LAQARGMVDGPVRLPPGNFARYDHTFIEPAPNP